MEKDLISEAYVSMITEREFVPLSDDRACAAASKFKVGDSVTSKDKNFKGKILSPPDALGWHKVDIGNRTAIMHTTNLNYQ